MELREYQNAALRTIFERMVQKDNILIELPTGAGKTIIFSALIRQMREKWRNSRVMVLAHREQLVEQAADKFMQVAPYLQGEVGIACASRGRVDIDRQIVIGSVQTVARRLERSGAQFPRFDVLIIDEAHRIPPRRAGKTNQYQDVITGMRKIRPGMRLVGVTATPYIMRHGRIYGEEGIKAGEENWFAELDYSLQTADLVEKGFLVPYRAKHMVDMSEELSGVGLTMGEYKTDELSEVMRRNVHVEESLQAFREHHEGRHRAIAFCVDIAHAEKMAVHFRENGLEAVAVHSGLKKAQRERIYADFHAGKIDLLCNVRLLTEGWDAPEVDLILFCCPTKSKPLYIQEVGRGLRPAEGKRDCLLLDLSGNCLAHGDPGHPAWTDFRERQQNGDGQKTVTSKVCPLCGEINFIGALRCSGKDAQGNPCSHVWKREEPPASPREVKMQEVDFEKLRRMQAVEERGEPFRARVYRATFEFSTTKTGKLAGVFHYYCQTEFGKKERVSYYLYPGVRGSWQERFGSAAWRFFFRRLDRVPPYPTNRQELDKWVDHMADPKGLLLYKEFNPQYGKKFTNIFAWLDDDGQIYLRESRR